MSGVLSALGFESFVGQRLEAQSADVVTGGLFGISHVKCQMVEI
jgi:hypothetical protein